MPPAISSEKKMFKYYQAVMVADTNFQKFLFLCESMNFIMDEKYCQLFSLK